MVCFKPEIFNQNCHFCGLTEKVEERRLLILIEEGSFLSFQDAEKLLSFRLKAAVFQAYPAEASEEEIYQMTHSIGFPLGTEILCSEWNPVKKKSLES